MPTYLKNGIVVAACIIVVILSLLILGHATYVVFVLKGEITAFVTGIFALLGFAGTVVLATIAWIMSFGND